ncbi:hypothetical protein FPZ12_005145 [Amycolatopsis acidicola]|uniref:Outer membrane channel protein CpnT-like N-terminal domain-containing protein n=1 Tax=Amycolatopsis acidicola TaxID=2596893 RepID=A0A5N0VKJ5_9PSEU|nr:hypothetical protein [Amycolatopsis acidicola]KAA9165864.1 hypothetical protein FPZ12_005145 [Amycolatopsis acidicola]
MTTRMVLPPALSQVLNTLGFSWPEGDEGKIFDLAGEWNSFADQLHPSIDQAHQHVEEVWSKNHAKGIDQLKTFWTDSEAPKKNLDDGATAATMIGAGLNVCAGIMVALKVAVIAELVALTIQIAQAIATAVVTFGASLAEIPVFRMITKTLLDQALDLAIGKVLNG